MAENMVNNITSIEEDQKVKDYSARLRDLRKDGITKISDCRLEIVALKKNKLMDEGEKNRKISELQSEIEKAKAVEEKNKAEIDALSKEAVAYVNAKAAEIEKAVTERQKSKMAKAKEFYVKEVEQIKADADTAVQDWLGIKATHLNAMLIKGVFSEYVLDDVVTDPTAEDLPFTGRILAAGGWKPGFSTDTDAVDPL